MLPAAEERTPALTSVEEIFSLAAGVALAALDMHQGAREAQGKKPHQGIFSKKRALRVSPMWAKWSGTHQDRKCSWSETVSGSALDANGNTLSDASGKSYTWDFENRLTQALVPGTDGGTTTFKYDPFGRRIQKSGPLGTTNYLYDGKKLVEEVDQADNVLARYAQGKRLDEPLAELRQTTTSYYEQDGLGSVTSLSNSAGAVAETYAYDSYGKATASTGTLVNPFQYTGREFDSETGVYYYRARYFDPSAGRFLSQDPVRYGGGVNFYAYTRNNPVARIDPFGHDGPCNNPAYCAPGSATWGTMYLGPDGVWYNDGPPPGPEPSVPNDGPTPSPNPPDPNTKCDRSQDQPQDPPPPVPKPPDPILQYAQCVEQVHTEAEHNEVTLEIIGGIGLGNGIMGCVGTGPLLPECEAAIAGVELFYSGLVYGATQYSIWEGEGACMKK